MPDARELDHEFMDLFLLEEVGGRPAPDLSTVILRRIAAVKAGPAHAAGTVARAPTARFPWAVLAAAAVVALVVGVAFWAATNNRGTTNSLPVALENKEDVKPPAPKVNAPENKPEIVANPKPEPQPAPEPAPTTTPEPAPEPQPELQPTPEPEPAPEPTPEPEPAPEPTPEPEPAPEPTPEPEPAPEPTPEPEPAPEPTPEPEPTPQPEPAPAGTLVSGPKSKVEKQGNTVTLEQGWVLVATGAPMLRVGKSQLADVLGRAVVCTPGPATRAMVNEIEQTLLDTPAALTPKEKEMLLDGKNWLKKTGFALCVLAGIAMLDGTRIEAALDKSLVKFPYTLEEEKAFIRPGMKFTWETGSYGKAEGKVVQEVLELTATGYRVRETKTGKDVSAPSEREIRWGENTADWREKKATSVQTRNTKVKVGKVNYDCVSIMEVLAGPNDKERPISGDAYRIHVCAKLPGIAVRDEVLYWRDGQLRHGFWYSLLIDVELPVDNTLQLPWTREAEKRFIRKGLTLTYDVTLKQLDAASREIKDQSFSYTCTEEILSVNEQGYRARVAGNIDFDTTTRKVNVQYVEQDYTWGERTSFLPYPGADDNIGVGATGKPTKSEQKIKVGRETLDCQVFVFDSPRADPNQPRKRVYTLCKDKPGVMVAEREETVLSIPGKPVQITTRTLTGIKEPK